MRTGGQCRCAAVERFGEYVFERGRVVGKAPQEKPVDAVFEPGKQAGSCAATVDDSAFGEVRLRVEVIANRRASFRHILRGRRFLGADRPVRFVGDDQRSRALNLQKR